ncbi:MAG: winged helix-turn-helix domain-containing protein [Acidobacteriota bacterium]|nr:winged helix-turn-helix domain-containing protein [Acidobacteriota bacterium]
MSSQTQHFYEFGPFRLDPAERLLSRDGSPVPLTPKVFEVLIMLVERSGRLVEKDELMRALWPDTVVEEANLTNSVYALRKALGGGQSYIETVPKHGYRFVAEVRSLPDRREEVLVVEKHTLTHTITEEDVPAGDEPDKIALSPAPTSLAAGVVGPQRTERALPLSRALFVAALLVVGATAAFGIYRLISQRQPKVSATAAVSFSVMDISRLTTSGKITHAAISPDGEYVAHVMADAEGDSLWVRHVAAPSSVRIAGPAATEYVWVTFAPDGDSVYYLTLGRGKGETALYRAPVLGGPSSMAAYDVGPVGFSPDGRQLTFIRMYNDESRLIVADADGTNERALATRRRPEFFRVDWNAPAWSPDGKTIVCQVRLKDGRGQYETVIGVSVEDGSQSPLTSERWHHVGQPAWLADGSGVLVTASESATAPVQVWHVALRSGEASRVTRDLNDYHDLSLTRDSGKLAAVQDHTVSSIWVAPDGDAGRPKQIASEVGWIQEMAWTPDGRIVYRSNAGGTAEIWVMGADGSNPKQLTADARASRGLSVSPDGRYIFFASDRAGRFNIWRADADGGNLTRLTAGEDEFYPHPTPDGRWVVYQRGEIEPRLWKVPTDGGEPVQLTETRACRPAVSPDGEMIAYHYLDPVMDGSQWGIGIVSSEGGQRLKRFDFPPTLAAAQRFVRWSPDRQSIAYANNLGGLSDIWLQPLDGSRPRRLTDFKAEQIIAFDWSRDGRALALVRGVETSDVVLIANAPLK